MSRQADSIQLTDFHSRAADITLACDKRLFVPDQWNIPLIQAMYQLDDSGIITLKDSVLAEGGLGMAVNAAGFMTAPNSPDLYIGVDINPASPEVSNKLMENLGLADKTVFFESDLFKNVPDALMQQIDHGYACSPQVPRPEGMDIMEGNNSGDFYIPTGQLDEYGLGLQAKTIDDFNARAPQASLTLNLAGRPRFDTLAKMFNDKGRDIIVPVEAVVKQDLGTSLESLAKLETQGHMAFEFFKNANGTGEMNAQQAEVQRLADIANKSETASFYHKIYVVHSPALTSKKSNTISLPARNL